MEPSSQWKSNKINSTKSKKWKELKQSNMDREQWTTRSIYQKWQYIKDKLKYRNNEVHRDTTSSTWKRHKLQEEVKILALFYVAPKIWPYHFLQNAFMVISLIVVISICMYLLLVLKKKL